MLARAAMRRCPWLGLLYILCCASTQADPLLSGLGDWRLQLKADNSTVINPDLLEAPRGSRQLLSATYNYQQLRQTGRYVIIKNPAMPGGRSSTGQVAIHAFLLPESYKIVIAGRNLPKKGPKSIPEPGVYGNVSTIYDVKSGTYTVAPNFETLFCTAHSHVSDGNIVAAGGDMGFGYSWMKEGRDVVRIFDRSSLKWITLPGVKLSQYRWYPTQVNLPDDRVIIVSGFLDDPARKDSGKPAPSIDVFDYRSKSITIRKSKEQLGKRFFTNVTPGYQLYPTVFLLPWTDPSAPNDYFLWFYSCRTGQVVRFTSDGNFQPIWNAPGLPVTNMCAAFSAMGSSVIMPLSPDNGYAVEVAMFGGGTQGKGPNGIGLDCKGICNAPASSYIFRMRLPSVKDALQGKWPRSWQYAGANPYETMPYPRVFADAVLLPNGKIVVLNGAQRGVPGGTIEGAGTAKQATYTALLYDPTKPAGQRITKLASSTIKRYYHSNALLLPSGDVWVAGNEQDDCVDDCATGGAAPPNQEYRAELLQLPYAFVPRPEILGISDTSPRYGQEVTITHKSPGPITSISIIPPGANTHSLNMMQRLIYLRITSGSKVQEGAGLGTLRITVQMPSAAARVANPGYYMLWIMAGDVPCKEARWIKLG